MNYCTKPNAWTEIPKSKFLRWVEDNELKLLLLGFGLSWAAGPFALLIVHSVTLWALTGIGFLLVAAVPSITTRIHESRFE